MLFCTSQFRSIEKSFSKENKCCVENSSGSRNISQLGLANQHTFIWNKKRHDRFKMCTNFYHILRVRIAWNLIRQVITPHVTGWAIFIQLQSHIQYMVTEKIGSRYNHSKAAKANWKPWGEIVLASIGHGFPYNLKRPDNFEILFLVMYHHSYKML